MWDEILNPRLSIAVLTLTTVACGTGASPAGPTVPTTAASTFTLSGQIFENLAGTKQVVGGATLGLWGVPCASAPFGGSSIPWYGILGGNNVVSNAAGLSASQNRAAGPGCTIIA